MRWLRPACLVAAAMAASGCFHFSTVIHVRGDGSGTIQQRLVISQAGLDQLKQLSALSGRDAFDPLSEDEARAGAERLGPGVALASTTPITENGGRGRESIYAFSDISKIHVSQEQDITGGAMRDVRASDTLTASLKRQDDRAQLTISVPQPTLPAARSNSRAGTGNGLLEQLAMAKEMFQGAQVSIAVEPAGTIVHTNSAFVDGRVVTLFDVNLDQLMADDTLPARLQSAKSAEEMKTILKDAPGLKVNFDREITIEFTPDP